MVNIRDLSKETLVEIFKEAVTASRVAASKVEDRGSCNLDSVSLYWSAEYGRWSKKLSRHLEEAAKEAGIYVSYFKRNKELYFGFRSYGQGYKRTVGMEAASQVLNKHGIDTSVRYVLD